LAEYEIEMNNRAANSKVLAGIPFDDIATTACVLPVREGCLNLLSHLKTSGVPVAVISINLSSELIRAALNLAQSAVATVPLKELEDLKEALPAPTAPKRRGWLQCLTPWNSEMMSVVDLEGDADEEGSMRVYANELEVRLGRTTGGIKRLVQGPLDKGDCFERICSKAKLTPGIRIFIGDSINDLPPLLAADVGILLGMTADLQTVAAKFHIQLRPLISCALAMCSSVGYTAGSQKNQSLFPSPWSVAGSGIIYVAKSWEEVTVFLASRGVEGLVPMGARLPKPFTGVDEASVLEGVSAEASKLDGGGSS